MAGRNRPRDAAALVITRCEAGCEPHVLLGQRHGGHVFMPNKFVFAIAAGLAVVSIVQELFCPLGDNVAIDAEIDGAARDAGVAVTSVGINPGFAMDLVPIVCSVACWEVQSVNVRRHVDFSPYGPDEMVHIGAGLTEDEFRSGAASGSMGHIGLLETAAMISRCLGLGVDELRQTKEPLISDRPRTTSFVAIPADRVYGFRQDRGWRPRLTNRARPRNGGGPRPAAG